MAAKRYKLRELPYNAKIYYPSSNQWRDKQGHRTKAPIDEPTFRSEGGYYTKYRPKAGTTKPKKKPVKKAAAKAKKKPAKKKAVKKKSKPKSKPEKPRPTTVEETIAQRLKRPEPLIRLMERRRLMPYGEDLAAAFQESMHRQIEKSMQELEDKLRRMGISAGYLVSSSRRDFVINAELSAEITGAIPVLGLLDFIRKNTIFPATSYGAVGFRFSDVDQDVIGSFEIVSLVTGDVMSRDNDEPNAYQIFLSYNQDQYALQHVWKEAEEVLRKIYRREKDKHHRPTEIVIRMHWNPYKDENGKPFAPAHRPLKRET